MANLPSIWPNQEPPKKRSTWRCRNREEPSCFGELQKVKIKLQYGSDVDTSTITCNPTTSRDNVSDSVITTFPSGPSASHMDHDYLQTKSDSSSSDILRKLQETDPEFYEHYSEVAEKARAYDKAVGNFSILTLSSIKYNDKLARYYTGFQNYATFMAFFKYLEPKAHNLQYYGGGGRKRKASENFKDKGNYTRKPGPDRRTSLEDELFMTLYRLRLGVPSEECAHRFGLKHTTYDSIFNTWVVFIALELEALCKINENHAKVQQGGKCFQKFPDVVIVLDCTELFAETPSSLKAHKQLFSNYKHHSTVKFLVGISPFGAITYISSMFGGIASDKFITRVSEDLVGVLKRGDSVMGDRAYTIQEDLPPGVSLITPCMKRQNQTQFTKEQVISSQQISKARIHVERAIGRIKSYGLLEREVKICSIKHFEYVFKACGYLVNFQNPFLKLSDEKV